MPRDLALRIVDNIARLMRYHPAHPVSINGHGETTYYDGWHDICGEFERYHIPLRITTNLAKKYSKAELDTLSRMTSIGVSIDTADASLLKRMRRKTDLRQIITNIQLIRAAAISQGIQLPAFGFGTGIYDKSVETIGEFADFSIAMHVSSIHFWSLSVHDPRWTGVPEADRPVPLDQLPPPRLRVAIREVRAAISKLQRHGIRCDVAGQFIDVLHQKLEAL